MKHPQTGICREGCPFLALVAFSALLFAILGLWFPALACLLLLWLSSHFFRDPERVCPQERHCALSPADGRIVRIEQADEPFTGKRLTCISIFMNLFDVHVNRMPVDARIEDIRYYPGKFFNASLDKASRDNERCAYALKADDGDFVMVQIAGLIARRIVSYAETGDMGKKGERIGMIKFGFRVDLYLPPNYAPRIAVGQKVFAGQSIVAARLQPCSTLPSEDRKRSPSPESLPSTKRGKGPRPVIPLGADTPGPCRSPQHH